MIENPLRSVMSATAQPRQTWQETEELLEGASEAETLNYLHDIAELMGYDHANLRFESMPGHVGGYTHTDYEVMDDGEIVITANDIYLNEMLLPGEHEESLVPVPALFRDTIDFYDEAEGLLDTFYHELGHGKQFRDIKETDQLYTEEELDALLPLHEGQTSYNADDASYRDMNEFYEAFLDEVEGGESPGDALYDMSEEYRVDVVHLEDDGDGIYDFIVTPRDEDLDERELYEMVEDAYGMDVLEDKSYEVDFREYDADKLGEHIIQVQDEIETGYGEVAAEYGSDMLPSGYENVMPEQPVE